MRFENKTALITGAAVGIGRAVAVKMAKEGANLVLVDFNSENLEKLAKELEFCKDRILTLVCDVSDENKAYETVKSGLEKFGKIDILINNAALWRDVSPFVDTPVETWKKYFDINVFGVVYFTKAVLPGMIERKYGKIINVASVAGVYGNRNMAHYSATKGALISMTKSLAKEVVGCGVVVNAVSPGTVSPSDVDDMDYVQPIELSYMGRTGSDNENANLICFLASDEAPYICGQNIQIDGCRRII